MKAVCSAGIELRGFLRRDVRRDARGIRVTYFVLGRDEFKQTSSLPIFLGIAIMAVLQWVAAAGRDIKAARPGRSMN
jgi:hypothetical protein